MSAAPQVAPAVSERYRTSSSGNGYQEVRRLMKSGDKSFKINSLRFMKTRVESFHVDTGHGRFKFIKVKSNWQLNP